MSLKKAGSAVNTAGGNSGSSLPAKASTKKRVLND